MKKICNDVKLLDKVIIYNESFFKVIRGFLKRFFFKKSKGLLFIGRNTKISHANNIMVGKNVKFERNSEIQGLSKKGLIFEDNVTIGAFTMIRPSSYYGVDIGEGLKIKKNSSIGPLSYIGCAGYIEIGENVMIGPKVSFFAENHNFGDKKTNIKEQGTNRKGIVIEDNCWIGSNVVILDGVRIGHGSIIGAGTIITGNIPPNSKVIDKRNKIIVDR